MSPSIKAAAPWCLSMTMAGRDSTLSRSGMRNAAGGDDPSPTPNEFPAHHSLDMAAELRINPHFTLYGNVTNLTDKQTIASWRPFGARPTHPRKWMVGLKARL